MQNKKAKSRRIVALPIFVEFAEDEEDDGLVVPAEGGGVEIVRLVAVHVARLVVKSSVTFVSSAHASIITFPTPSAPTSTVPLADCPELEIEILSRWF